MKVKGNLDVEGTLTQAGSSVSGSVTFTDGTTTKEASTLHFSDSNFYLTASTSGGVVANKKFRGVATIKTSSQACENLDLVAISWDGTEYDTEGFFNISNPTILTIPAGVTKIRLIGACKWDDNTTGGRLLSFTINDAGGFRGASNSSFEAGIVRAGSNNFQFANITSGFITVKEGDIIALKARQGSGGSLNVEAAFATFLTVEVID